METSRRLERGESVWWCAHVHASVCSCGGERKGEEGGEQRLTRPSLKQAVMRRAAADTSPRFPQAQSETGRPRSGNGRLGDRPLLRCPPWLRVPSPGHLQSPAVALHTSHHRAACISPFFCARAAQTLGELTAQAQRQPRMTGCGEGAAGLCPRHPGPAAVTSVRLGCHPWSSFPCPVPHSRSPGHCSN